jgi:predicted Holliday junction resolvase-like endonuclease
MLRLSKNFFVKYWPIVLIIVIIIVISIKPVAKQIRRKIAKNKLKKLQLELPTLNQLLKKAQEKRFKYATITEDTYKVIEKKYKSRELEIKRTIPVLESVISGKKPEKTEENKEKTAILKV